MFDQAKDTLKYGQVRQGLFLGRKGLVEDDMTVPMPR
jgi:hypothetical protein